MQKVTFELCTNYKRLIYMSLVLHSFTCINFLILPHEHRYAA